MVVKIVGHPDLDELEAEIKGEFNHHNLFSSHGCVNILKVYAHSIRERLSIPHLGYIYMEYAAFGDLEGLIEGLAMEPEWVVSTSVGPS